MDETRNTVVDVVVAGHTCLDFLPDLSALPAGALETQGRLFQIGGLSVTTGGAVPNTGLALHHLGNKVRLLTSVGDDLVGGITLDVIRQVSPALIEHIRTRPIAGSYAIVVWRPGLDRTFLHCTGPNDAFSVDDIDFSLVDGARWFHLGYPSLLPCLFAREGQGLVEVMRRAKEAGTVTSLDFTLPDPATASGKADWPRILRAALPFVDVFVPSLEELVFLLRRDHYLAWAGDVIGHLSVLLLDELLDEMLSMGPAVAGIKLGEQGLILRGNSRSRMAQVSQLGRATAWAGQTIRQQAFAVTVQGGTTGAGDSAYAGLITGMLQNLEPQDVARLACAAGAARVETVDGAPILHWRQLLARFDRNAQPLPSPWLADN